jgi:glycosyltransferase involved in cell wall biosynthesis
MIKKTHEFLAKIIYDNLPDNQKRLISVKHFLKGSIYPDIYLPYRLMQHDYKGSFNLVMSLINSIILNKHSKKDLGFKLGIISHFLADYTCAYHSNTAYKYKHYAHRLYELRIHSYLSELSLNESPKIESLKSIKSDIEFYLEYNQVKDVLANPKRDLHHAFSLASSLVSLVLEEHSISLNRNSFANTISQRVVIFSDTYFPHVNGVSNTLFQYLQFLKKTRQPYLLISPKYKSIYWDKELGFNIHKVKSIKFPFYPTAKVPLPNKKKLKRILDDFKPDIIHCMTEFSLGYFGMRYAKSHNIPIVSNFSSYFDRGLKHYKIGFLKRPLNNYLKWFHNKADLTTCPSEVTKDYLLDTGIYPVKVFTRGVDRNVFSPNYKSQELRKNWDAEDKTVFLYVGRISGEKDIYVLCQAYKYLSDEIKSRTKLVVTGDGPILKKLIKTYPEIIFTGQKTQEELSKHYASADVFVFPSSSETFGNVCLEAMSSGLPAIVVDQGGVKTFVKDGVNGLVVKPKDSEEFQNALLVMAINKKLRLALAKKALETAKERTWEDVFSKLQFDYNITLNQVPEIECKYDYIYQETRNVI